MASAKAAGSAGGTSDADSPSVSVPGMPPTAVETIGHRAAIASRITIGSPSQVDDSAKMSKQRSTS